MIASDWAADQDMNIFKKIIITSIPSPSFFPECAFMMTLKDGKINNF